MKSMEASLKFPVIIDDLQHPCHKNSSYLFDQPTLSSPFLQPFLKPKAFVLGVFRSFKERVKKWRTTQEITKKWRTKQEITERYLISPTPPHRFAYFPLFFQLSVALGSEVFFLGWGVVGFFPFFLYFGEFAVELDWNLLFRLHMPTAILAEGCSEEMAQHRISGIRFQRRRKRQRERIRGRRWVI